MNPTRRPVLLARVIVSCLLLGSLAACEQLGVETPAQTAALRDAEGKAIGGACRHAGRALEDCYQLNPRYSKASVYNGWRDMDTYMRENKLETVEPEYEPGNAGSRAARKEADKKETEKPAAKAADATKEGATEPAAKEGEKAAAKEGGKEPAAKEETAETPAKPAKPNAKGKQA